MHRKISRAAALERLSTPLAGLQDFLRRLASRVDDNLATFSDSPSLLVAAAPGPVTASPAERTISGLIVPFGPAGATSGGLLTFSAGSLRWSEPRRVKLLVEHDQGRSVGFATSIEERPEGLWATFSVPEGPEGDQVLTQAANGVRDAFSVGVMLDASVQTNLRRATNGAPVKGTGELRETSMVSVPAFDSARVESVAASIDAPNLVVSGWADANERNTMTEAQRRRLAALLAQASLTQDEAAERDTLQGLATAAGITVTAAAPSTDTTSTTTTTAAATSTGAPAPSGPQVVAAAAGNAYVEAEASIYTFGGGGHSLVRDAFYARAEGDAEAADRIRRFNAQVADGNPASVQALATAAAETTTTAPDVVPTLHRPDLMRAMIDRARPVISRVPNIPITSATPFNIPEVGDFTGVAEHVEGTAHAAEGDLAVTGSPVQPRATSGAYRISRELVDASNPALDRIALRKMVKDYRGLSESKMVAALIAADTAADVLSVSTVMGLRAQLLAFINDDDEGADFVACSPDFLSTLGADVDGTGRPHLPVVGPMNALGTWKPGGTGSTVENAELVRAARVTASKAIIVRSEGALWFESPVQQFSFSEVEGPGIIKLALWAYTAAAVPDSADVRVLDVDATA